VRFLIIISLFFLGGCASKILWEASEFAETSVQRGINQCQFEAYKANAQGGYQGAGIANAVASAGRENKVFYSCMVAKGFYEVKNPEEK